MTWISRAIIVIAVFFALVPYTRAEPADWQRLGPLLAEAGPLEEAPDFKPSAGKPVIVTFFASWCPPCTDEFAHLNKIAANADFADAQIVGVNVFEDFGGVKNPERMVRFLERTDPQFELVKGSPAIRAAFGNVDRIPTVVVFDGSGLEVWRFVHERDAVKTHATEADLVKALGMAQRQ